MSPIAPPPKPASPTGHWLDTATVHLKTYTKDAQGFVGPSDGSTVTNVPCRLDPATSKETLAYAKNTDQVVYMLFLPLMRPGGSAALVVAGSDEFTISSVVYEAVGAAEPYPRGGVQRVPVTARAR